MKSSLQIESPGFPGNYPDNVDCRWRIVGPVGHYLSFSFVSLDLPRAYNCSTSDYVQVEETNATSKATLYETKSRRRLTLCRRSNIGDVLRVDDSAERGQLRQRR
jgi:hypothetical protein